MSAGTALPGLEPRTCLRIGRKRMAHLPRVLIEDDRVVLRTRCKLDPMPEGVTETCDIPTCEPCIEHWEAS